MFSDFGACQKLLNIFPVCASKCTYIMRNIFIFYKNSVCGEYIIYYIIHEVKYIMAILLKYIIFVLLLWSVQYYIIFIMC